MPRYFFDVQSRSGLVCADFHGLECRDDAAALSVARHGAGFTSQEDCRRNPRLNAYRFAVADAEHRPLFTVPFSDLEPDPPATPEDRAKDRPKRRRGPRMSS
ncbi:hypothetical protein [Methylobacterium sp.]|uniref:DUF6894 family protein n=1 Tax=Methylobacterium sp. TaxID=409 RepID=UPI00258FB135|nr:hypothetical protein [Methylobacterium sp.]